MANNREITQEIGNLKGFSTDSIFIRPPNVATIAKNLQRAPNKTIQIRRGFQCQIAAIGGMGIGTFADPALDEIQTICIGMDGFGYNKLTQQIFLYYNGQITGEITAITQGNPGIVTDVAHGLITGTQIIIRNVLGMIELNGFTFTITVIDANHFSIGVDTTGYLPYVSGGTWSVAFADQRSLGFSIFTDPRFIYFNSGQSITCDILVYRAAQINGTPTLTNTLPLQFGSSFMAGQVVQFTTTSGVLTTANVLSATTTSITIDGPPVTIPNGSYLTQFLEILFGKGFDMGTPYTIAQFLAAITDPTSGISGLKVSINGLSDLPAAFLQIVETTIIASNTMFSMDYWYWDKINYPITPTASPPLPGSANIDYQSSLQFENAAMSAYDDVIYITNGWDYPQKYDGQTLYRTGMPEGNRPIVVDYTTTFPSKPFSNGVYQYAMTYEQIDNRGHIVEGILSEIQTQTVTNSPCAEQITLLALTPTASANWNTNSANATGGLAPVYGPDNNGMYYNFVPVTTGYRLNIGDTAYYADLTCGVTVGSGNSYIIPVATGHGILTGDTVNFLDSTPTSIQRVVESVSTNSITLRGITPVSYTNAQPILVYKTGLVFADVAIVDGSQANVNVIVVKAYSSGHNIVVNDIVTFIDAQNNMQRRNVTAVSATTITIDGIPVNVSNLILISSLNQQPGTITIQRTNANGATLSSGTSTGSPLFVTNAISNNLRINIYRTMLNSNFGTLGKLYLVASIPNDGSGVANEVYIDGISDTELLRPFANPSNLPYPPPISKYVKSFGNQVFYAGGERGVNENSNRVFFSAGDNAEVVNISSDFFNVPNFDDEITGIGVSGSTVVTVKNQSVWGTTGEFLSGQIEVVQIAPGTNIGCVAHATIQSVGSLMYFLHTNGLYSITENQIFPTDVFGNPVPLTLPIDVLFRQTPYLEAYQFRLKRAVAINYTKDQQYLLFIPCEDPGITVRTANVNSQVLCYDYLDKNWFTWDNINAAGGFVVIDDNLYWQERRLSSLVGNTANLYKQHRFYRLIDHADHAGAQNITWLSSWTDLNQPAVRKKFSTCVLLMDRLSDLYQFNSPTMIFSTYLNRIPNLQNTIANVTTVDNIRNSSWSFSPWGWGIWSGYQDSFVRIELKRGTVAKSIQCGFTMSGINMDIRLSGFQLEVIPENRKTVAR